MKMSRLRLLFGVSLTSVLALASIVTLVVIFTTPPSPQNDVIKASPTSPPTIRSLSQSTFLPFSKTTRLLVVVELVLLVTAVVIIVVLLVNHKADGRVETREKGVAVDVEAVEAPNNTSKWMSFGGLTVAVLLIAGLYIKSTCTVDHLGRNKFPRGLENFGNTCFMNACLQCMAHLDMDHKLPTNDHLDGTLKKTLLAIKSQTGPSAVAPSHIYHYLRAIFDAELGKYGRTTYIKGQQHDASEFLGKTIDLCPDLKSQVQSKIKSTLPCGFCDVISESESLYTTLMLIVKDGQSVQTMLDGMLAPDHVTGWQCSKCNHEQSAVKQFAVLTTPPILIVHLLLFDNELKKINVQIRAEPILRFGGAEYRLQAVVIHKGSSLNNGHYVAALVRHDLPEGRVLEVSDETVRTAPSSLLDQPFLLFYKRQ